MKKLFFLLTALVVSVCAIAQDIIITTDAKKIEAKILEVAKSEIKYKEMDNLDGPTFILEIEEISSITYANGKVINYHPMNQPVEESSTTKIPTVDAKESKVDILTELNIGRVGSYGGIYVFTDCEPLSAYEVIGEVSITGTESAELQNSWGQYESVRNELVKIAKAANGQVEGVMLTLIVGSADKAHMIKFKNPSEDHSLAKAKRYMGLYVFCDNEPLNKYDYIGDLKGKFTFIPQYPILRDDFIKKCTKKYKNANGIILHLVTNGKDTAEAIKF